MEKIRLIGIRGDQNYEFWRRNINQVLQELNMQNSLEEINNINSILDLKVSAIPALIINDTILLEQNNHIPDIQEFKDSILDYLNQGL